MGIRLEYMPFSELSGVPQSWQNKVLGVVSFSAAQGDHRLGNLPDIHLNAAILSGGDCATEALLAETDAHYPLISGNKGAIHYRYSGELLFGVIYLDESSAFIALSPSQAISALQQATEIAYQQIFALIDELGYSYVYRFWNYMADINGNHAEDGLERYRQFNIGRKNVFDHVGREQGQQLPAACALGLRAGPLSIAFLAGKTPAIAIENPRQIKAYDYPEQYGPRTPSFSRATLAKIGQQHCLFISGTASIVGHETLHLQDIIGQTKETLINLEAVVSEANRIQGKPVFNLATACFRVYVRDVADLEMIRATMRSHFNHEVKALFVQADICREELLIEIEATLLEVTMQETSMQHDLSTVHTA